jgi:hypothetical protein
MESMLKSAAQHLNLMTKEAFDSARSSSVATMKAAGHIARAHTQASQEFLEATMGHLDQALVAKDAKSVIDALGKSRNAIEESLTRHSAQMSQAFTQASGMMIDQFSAATARQVALVQETIGGIGAKSPKGTSPFLDAVQSAVTGYASACDQMTRSMRQAAELGAAAAKKPQARSK